MKEYIAITLILIATFSVCFINNSATQQSTKQQKETVMQDTRKYVEIYYNKTNKTQRFVLVKPTDCTSTVEKELDARNISYTNNKFIGRYQPLKDYKSQTYKYAQNWQWLPTVDLTQR